MPYDLRGLFKAGAPPLGFRFGVFFFAGGVIPNPVDIRFSKASGLGGAIGLTAVKEGGQNLYTRRLPDRVAYDNLVLERGLVVGSPLTIEFNVAMTLFKFAPSNVLVTLFDDTNAPIAAWSFLNAYPVKWSVSDLDASAYAVVIEKLELAYERIQAIRL